MKELYLEKILDMLCEETDTNLFIVLPKKEEERIPYLKKEIIRVLNKIK